MRRHLIYKISEKKYKKCIIQTLSMYQPCTPLFGTYRTGFISAAAVIFPRTSSDVLGISLSTNQIACTFI